MSNSPLVSYTRISPNRSSPRNNNVLVLTPHHQAGNLTAQQLGAIMANPANEMSANYGIQSDGLISLHCPESDRSWCSFSPSNDNKAITVEIANDGGAPNWHVSDKAIDAFIRLSVDICQRHGISKVVYTGTPSGNLTRHNMFANTLCPGPYLQSRLPDIAATVNMRLSGSTAPTPTPEDDIMSMSTKPVQMWFGPMSGGDKNTFIKALNEKKISFTDDGGTLTTTVAVSGADQPYLMRLAITLGNIGYGPAGGASSGVSQAEYQKVVNTNKALANKISAARKSAQETVAALK